MADDISAANAAAAAITETATLNRVAANLDAAGWSRWVASAAACSDADAVVEVVEGTM